MWLSKDLLIFGCPESSLMLRLSLVVAVGLLTAAASLLEEHRL